MARIWLRLEEDVSHGRFNLEGSYILKGPLAAMLGRDRKKKKCAQGHSSN
jgi:hypothetical protein